MPNKKLIKQANDVLNGKLPWSTKIPKPEPEWVDTRKHVLLESPFIPDCRRCKHFKWRSFNHSMGEEVCKFANESTPWDDITFTEKKMKDCKDYKFNVKKMVELLIRGTTRPFNY